jgi:hypothetical protein
MRRDYDLGPLDLAARFDEIAERATGEVVGRLRKPKEAPRHTSPYSNADLAVGEEAY